MLNDRKFFIRLKYCRFSNSLVSFRCLFPVCILPFRARYSHFPGWIFMNVVIRFNLSVISAATISTTVTPTAYPLAVRQFPAFGNNSNDCSVRFSSTKHEQTGYWTCAARTSMNDPFTSTKPAKLSIVNANHGRMRNSDLIPLFPILFFNFWNIIVILLIMEQCCDGLELNLDFII